MDPNENINDQLSLAIAIAGGYDLPGDKQQLAELVLAMDEWLHNGGFLPEQWRRR